MSIGNSGRIVIEISPYLKRQLYSVLGKEGLNLKEWFLTQVGVYLASAGQLQLPISNQAKEDDVFPPSHNR